MSDVSIEQVRATYKSRDSWWTVLLVDPIACRLVQAIGGITWITPTSLTVGAFLVGMVAGGAFLLATPGWLIIGAVLYYLSFLVDCMDGKVARLRGTSSVLGSWLDFLLDRIRVVVCAVALFAGQFLTTGDDWFLLAATGITFLALFGYINGAETNKASAQMTAAHAAEGSGPPQAGRGTPLPPLAERLRAFLHKHRIRMNLVSAIEFEMAVLVVAPLAGALLGRGVIMWVAVGAGVLLVLFELALISRFLKAARSFDRRNAELPMPAPRANAKRAGSSGVEAAGARHPG